MQQHTRQDRVARWIGESERVEKQIGDVQCRLRKYLPLAGRMWRCSKVPPLRRDWRVEEKNYSESRSNQQCLSVIYMRGWLTADMMVWRWVLRRVAHKMALMVWKREIDTTGTKMEDT